MSFWELNKKKVLFLYFTLFVLEFSVIFFFVPDEDKSYLAMLGLGFATFMTVFPFLVACIPAIHAFSFINKLLADESDQSLLTLFDASYEVNYRNASSWLLFATPVVEGTVQDLPMVLEFQPGSRGTRACVNFKFSPLRKPNSKRIYSDGLFFNLSIFRKLKRDVKPEVLEYAGKLKEKGFTSGVGLPVSTKHVEQYDI